MVDLSVENKNESKEEAQSKDSSSRTKDGNNNRENGDFGSEEPKPIKKRNLRKNQL